jgi:hypothetical protein
LFDACEGDQIGKQLSPRHDRASGGLGQVSDRADPSTVRRWFCSLDSPRPPFSRLRTALETVKRWLAQGEVFACGSLRLSWPTVFPFLQVCWPLRL